MFSRKPPIEDPARIARFRDAIAVLVWEPATYRDSVNVLFKELSDLAYAEIRYYYSRRSSSRRLSWWCRALAWLAGAVGIVVPLLHPILGDGAPESFLSWGYLAFGFAGVVLLLNTLFAGSQAHHRYTKTQLELEHLYEAFSLRWHRCLVDLDANPTADAVGSLIDEARAFVESFHETLATETVEWKKDVDEGLSEMKGKISGGSRNQ